MEERVNCKNPHFFCLVFKFKVVARACYGVYFVVHVFKYLASNLFPGDLHDAVL